MSGVLPVTEAQAQRAVRELFELHGWEVAKTEEDRFRGVPGLPDLLCTSPYGLQLWIEMKRPASSRNPRGRVRKAQRERLTCWRRRGVLCCVLEQADDLAMYIASITAGGGDATPDSGGYLLCLCDSAMKEYEWWPA
jgi:hypothetical protein